MSYKYVENICIFQINTVANLKKIILTFYKKQETEF